MHPEYSLSARSTGTTLNSEPVITKKPPFHLRLAYFICLWSFKGFFKLSLGATRLFSRRRSDLLKPEVKAYKIRPDLKNRIFRPADSRLEQLPLYLDVHGGGWAVADPETDDEFCSFLAQTFRIIVVSVNYHKSPQYKFPHAVQDIIAITKAVMDDESLHVDKTQVALGGFSAGGNLAFSAAQSDGLRGKLSGIVAFYPVLDMAESLEDKLSRRPRDAPSDILASSANFLSWAYLPEGHNLRDCLLSPRWADPKVFPTHVYLVGAEYDMLCSEAEQMAEALAKYTATAECRSSISTLPDQDGWRQGGVSWECARGRDHAFTHIAKHGVKEIERVKFCKEMYSRVGHWLKEDVWKNSAAN